MSKTTLDEKLREIEKTLLAKYLGNPAALLPDALDEATAAIHVAFKESGYIQPDQEQLNNFFNQGQELMRLKLTPTPKHIYYKDEIPTGQSLMTGQEWLSRFMQELKTTSLVAEGADRLFMLEEGNQAIGAARRAAGVDHD